MMTAELSTALIERAAGGDDESRSVLAEAVRLKLYGYFNRVLMDGDLAEELAQQLVVLVLGAIQSLKHLDRFWPWVYRIASNRIRTHFRARSMQREISMSALADPEFDPPAPGGENSLECLVRQEERAMTRSALAELSSSYREALVLRFYEDRSHADVARILGCTESTARVTSFRARNALLRHLQRRGIHETCV